jgi:cell division protein FtsB
LLEQGTAEERENLTQQLHNLLQQRMAQQDNINKLESDRQQLIQQYADLNCQNSWLCVEDE